MAVEQLPATTYVVGGQPTVAGYILPEAQYGFEEQAETKYTAAGKFNAKLTFSRRATLKVTLELLTGTGETTYMSGGQISSGVFATGAGVATAWEIKSASKRNTRGPVVVDLDLIALSDIIT